jgi:ADP-heptose:LPS heptosyltransferase
MARSFPILFITATRIGDAVLSSGLVRKLAEEIPQARFTIAAGPDAAPLFAHAPGLDRVIVMEKQHLAGHWFDLWRQTRRTRWGLVVDLRGSGLARFLKAQKRIVARRALEPAHKVVEAARLLALADDPPAPHIFTDPETEAAADRLTAGQGPILAMAPGANWVGKTWPLERFSETARRLLAPDGALAGGRLMVLGSAADAPLARRLKATAGRGFIDLAGKVDLVTAHACLKHARLFIGNDSGAMHLAAAAGCPTLGLFGPSDERLYAPWGPNGRTVRGVRTFEQIRASDPALNQAITHMMDLPADRVVEAAKTLIRDTA